MHLNQSIYMKVLKPSLEKINPTFGSSFTVRQFDDPCRNTNPFWHFHPELELVFVKGGSGKRHIGNHLSYFHDGDLIFIGSNLPHSGFTDRLTGNESEIVVQMKSDFLGSIFFDIPEMLSIKLLFDRAKMGLAFYGETKKIVGERLGKLKDLEHFDRLLEFLSILKIMAESEEYKFLNVEEYALEVKQQDNERISEVYQFVRKNFQRAIPLDEISEVANMTVPAFCRYFKKQSGKTFTQFVNEFRIVHACKLLSEMPSSITEISFESGFNNFSHFNKLFKEITGKSPSAYRKELKQIVV